MHIRVLGAHLPRLNKQSIENFIDDDTAHFKTFMAERINLGKSNWTLEEVDARALEIAEDLRANLRTCALFEVEVTDNTQRFHASDLSNPVTLLRGWEPAYLSPDGESAIAEGSWVPAEVHSLRAEFYILEWEESGSPAGPTGDLDERMEGMFRREIPDSVPGDQTAFGSR